MKRTLASSAAVMAIHCQPTSSGKPSNSPVRVPQPRCQVSSRSRAWFSASSPRSGVGDDALGQARLFQMRPEVVPGAGRGQLGAQEQRDHLRLAAWPQPPHTQHLAPTPVAAPLPSCHHPGRPAACSPADNLFNRPHPDSAADCKVFGAMVFLVVDSSTEDLAASTSPVLDHQPRSRPLLKLPLARLSDVEHGRGAAGKLPTDDESPGGDSGASDAGPGGIISACWPGIQTGREG